MSAQRLLTVVAVVVLVFGGAQLFAGALSAGVTVDEPAQLERTDTWLENGWFVPERVLVAGNPDPGNPLASPFVYGPAFASIAHTINVIAGQETIGTVSHTASAYAVRHLTVALLAALVVATAGALVWLLSGSWRFGLWAAAALVAVPAWMGQGFFNVKDVPAAAGYTMVTAALVFALGADGGERLRDRRLLGVALLLGGGIFVGAGTRIALWAPLAASIVSYATLRVGQRRLGGVGREWRRDFAVGAGAALGSLAVVAVYPKAAETPRTMLTEAISGSAGYPINVLTLTAGQLLPEHPPWWYLPAWIGAGTPLLIGGLTILGIVLAVRALARPDRWRGHDSIWSQRGLGSLLVLQQALLLPAIAILGDAVMYDGSRQHLYVFPAIAILAGLGAERFWSWAQRWPGRAWPALAAAVLSLALLAPMVEQTRLFPYNYAYVNPLAGIGGVNGSWEADYWFASAPEALSHVPRGAPLHCSPSLTPPSDPDAIPDYDRCIPDQLDPRHLGDRPRPRRQPAAPLLPRGRRRHPPTAQRSGADGLRAALRPASAASGSARAALPQRGMRVAQTRQGTTQASRPRSPRPPQPPWRGGGRG